MGIPDLLLKQRLFVRDARRLYSVLTHSQLLQWKSWTQHTFKSNAEFSSQKVVLTLTTTNSTCLSIHHIYKSFDHDVLQAKHFASWQWGIFMLMSQEKGDLPMTPTQPGQLCYIMFLIATLLASCRHRTLQVVNKAR